MKIIKNKRLFLVLCFFALALSGIAQDTIRFLGNSNASLFLITVTQGKQFTVDWDNGDILTYTGTGEKQSTDYSYPIWPSQTGKEYWITIAGSEIDCRFTTFESVPIIFEFDASKAPSLEYIDVGCVAGRLRNVNLSNCSALEFLCCGSVIDAPNLKSLDLSDCISLKVMDISYTALSTLDVSNTVLEAISMHHCKFPLSQIYPIYFKANPFWSIYDLQRLDVQRIFIKDTVDFSSEKEFDGIATIFEVYRGNMLAPESTYSLKDGMITFHKGGNYTVVTANAAMMLAAWYPIVYAPIFVATPVEEIVNVPTTAIAGKMLYLTGSIIPGNATNIRILWSVYDAGTTGAYIESTSLYTTAPGTVIVTATIKDGSGTGIDYTQNFSIEVKPLGVDENAELSGVRVFPNPTTGELNIEYGILNIDNVEVFDVYGRNQKIIVNSQLSILNSIDISHLPAGTYFVKIITEQGEIVKKVVKH